MSETRIGPARDRLREVLSVAGVLALGLGLRLSTWTNVFRDGEVWIDGPDGYYHLRRAWLTLQNWPWTPQFDRLIGVPEGGPISWPPVFDLMLATLALPWRSMGTDGFERLSAFLPPILGVVEILALFWLVRRLLGARAAVWSAFFCAVLPGAVRYSLIGALDHDPLVESLALLGLVGFVGAMAAPRWRVSDVVLVGAAAALLILTWAGSLLQLALWCLVVALLDWPSRSSRSKGGAGRLAMTLGLGCLAAAAVTLPFVLSSVWTKAFGATFVGLSWLHTAALLAAAAGGFGLAAIGHKRDVGKWGRSTWLLLLCFVGLLPLFPVVWPAVVGGLQFFGRGEDFLQSVIESRPLLSLFGVLDVRAALVRLSVLPLAALLVVPWALRRSGWDRRLVLLLAWFGYMFALALVQARYAHAAALPAAALGGLLASDVLGLWPERRRLVAVLVTVAVLATSAPAYLSVRGFAGFRFLDRPSMLAATGMDEVCDFLRERGPASDSWADPGVPSATSVLADWSFGHWLMWRARQGTVGTPLGPQGQPAFADGLRYLYADAGQAREIIDRRRVRYVVARAEVPQLDVWSDLAGVDASSFFVAGDGPKRPPLRAEVYLPTVAARLSWIGSGEVELFGQTYSSLEGFKEVFRSRAMRESPFGGLPGIPRLVPVVRVYEIVRAAKG